jgi:hypothetical protein
MFPVGLVYFFVFWLSLVRAFIELRTRGWRAFRLFAVCNAMFIAAIFVGLAVQYAIYGTIRLPHAAP